MALVEGVEDEHGVFGHGLGGLVVGQAAVEVQGQLTVAVHGQSRAGVHSQVNLLVEQLFHPLQGLGVHLHAACCCYHTFPLAGVDTWAAGGTIARQKPSR